MKTTPDSETPAVRGAALNVEPPSLTLEQRQTVLSAASSFVAGAILGRPVELDDPTLAGAAGILVAGAYVTLKRQGHLRACCGSLGARKTLLQTLSHAAFTHRDGRPPAASDLGDGAPLS